MDPNLLDERLQYAIELAYEAGKIIKENTGKMKSICEKETYADLVTEVDKSVEQFLFEKFKKKFPSDRFIGEESEQKAEWTNEPTWIIDPIDGTTNFVHTFPYSCVSIGFTVNKQPYIGVVYNPHFDHLYKAIKGVGAKLVKDGGKQEISLNVRECPSLSEALVVTELGSARDDEKKVAVFKNLESVCWNSHGVRALGSAAMNMTALASGQVDGYYEFGLHIWDIAASALIIEEANGFVCDTKGGPLDLQSRRILAASSEKLARELVAAMSVHLELPRD